MKLAKEQAACGVAAGEGGPFGAVIIDKDGDIVSEGNNKVLCNNDPTAHAEIVAMRTALRSTLRRLPSVRNYRKNIWNRF